MGHSIPVSIRPRCGVDLHAVATELYGALPEDFGETRKTLASEARAAGDPDLAAAIQKLRRPTTGAWLANLLVRERAKQIAGLLALGVELREAQASLVGPEMRRLSLRRRRLVTTLGDAARQLASERGKDVGEASIRELEETLEAAVADPDAGNALASGNLVTAMHYSGLGPVVVSDVVGAPTKRRFQNRSTPKRTSGSQKRQQASGQADANDAVAIQRLRDAGAELAQAQSQAAEAASRRQLADSEAARSDRAVAQAEGQLRALRDEQRRLRSDLRKANQALAASDQDVHNARKKVEQARSAAPARRQSRWRSSKTET